MALALYGAVVLDWPYLVPATRAAFGALRAPAAVTLYVAERAWRAPGGVFVDRIGLTLIALFDGFAIITALDADEREPPRPAMLWGPSAARSLVPGPWQD